MPAPVHLIQPDERGNRLAVHLLGDLDVTAVASLHDELDGFLGGQTFDAVSIHLRQLTDCSIAARGGLVRVNLRLASHSRRRAYVASSPRFRGIALWVLHVSPDPYGKVVMNEVGADNWFRSDVSRYEQAMQGMRTFQRGQS